MGELVETVLFDCDQIILCCKIFYLTRNGW